MNLNPPYVPIVQERFCCVPACVFMILRRRRISDPSQEEIGWGLGLTVPKESAALFSKVRTGKKPKAGWGTQIQAKQYSLGNYFRKNKIPLDSQYFFPKSEKDMESFATNQLERGNDLLVLFNYKKLYGGVDAGHASLIQGISNGKVTLIDPERNVPKKRIVPLKQLWKSIQRHGKGKGGGFWAISGKN